jgi:hypothetical protein
LNIKLRWKTGNKLRLPSRSSGTTQQKGKKKSCYCSAGRSMTIGSRPVEIFRMHKCITIPLCVWILSWMWFVGVLSKYSFVYVRF